MKTLRILTVIAAVFMLTKRGNAEFIMTIDQTGPGLSFNGSGSINTGSFTAAALNAPTAALLEVQPDIAFLAITPATNLDEYNMADSGPAGFGPGDFTSGSTGSVAGVFIFEQDSPGVGAIDLPAGYVSGSPLTASATWAGVTYDSLGITPGTYTWTWGTGPTADSFELDIVPEPSSLALLGMAAAIFGLGAWTRRRRPDALAA